jgi:hypothetical protein
MTFSRDAFLAMPFLGVKMVIMPIYPTTIIDDPDGLVVSGRVRPEDEVFMISILTQQSRKQLRKIALAAKGNGVMATGKWSDTEFTGNSGEVYRPFIGTISLMMK